MTTCISRHLGTSHSAGVQCPRLLPQGQRSNPLSHSAVQLTRNNLQFSDDHDANISSITKPSSPVPVYCSGCLNAFGARFSHNLWGFDASNQCNNSRAMIDWFPSDVIRLVTVINVCFPPPQPRTIRLHQLSTTTGIPPSYLAQGVRETRGRTMN